MYARKILKDFVFQSENGKSLNVRVVTTDQVLTWSADIQQRFRTELGTLFSAAFPKMPESSWQVFIHKCFRSTGEKFNRQIMIFRDKENNLAAVAVYDWGSIGYREKEYGMVYNILRAILPAYQETGVGSVMSVKILKELQPDILMVTSYQSSALHSWIGLVRKKLIRGYEVFPHIETINGEDVLIHLPHSELEFAISAFRQSYARMAEEGEKAVPKALRNLTVYMVRKDDHGDAYDFDPWEKHGRKDPLAQSLGLTSKDGVLVMFRKIVP